MASIHPFIQHSEFDDATTKIMAQAFVAAIKELPAIDHPELIHELMAKRIVLAGQEGDRDVNVLPDSAVALLASLAGELTKKRKNSDA
jgi:hypothetical protein